jgi:hypothetical protein
MEAQVPAYRLDEITGLDVSADGQHALMRVRAGDTEQVLALPYTMLIPLMQTASAAHTMCRRVLDVDDSVLHLVPTESCGITASEDFQHMIFTFKLPGGMAMSFPVPRRHAEPMRKLLAVFTQEPGTIPLDKAQ